MFRLALTTRNTRCWESLRIRPHSACSRRMVLQRFSFAQLGCLSVFFFLCAHMQYVCNATLALFTFGCGCSYNMLSGLSDAFSTYIFYEYTTKMSTVLKRDMPARIHRECRVMVIFVFNRNKNILLKCEDKSILVGIIGFLLANRITPRFYVWKRKELYGRNRDDWH